MKLTLVELSNSPSTVAITADSDHAIVAVHRPNGWEPVYKINKGEVVGLPQSFVIPDPIIAALDSLLVG
jgi:hypothetical protein